MDSWVIGIVQSLGYVGIALLMALENLFPPIPSELIMPLSGYTASQGTLNLWLVILIGSAGTLVGTLPWYAAARFINNQRFHRFVDRHGHWLTLDLDELERAERWFRSHGRWMVAVGRLIPGIRTLISIPAGFCKMPLGQYLAYSAVGTLAWSGILAAAGYALGQHYDRVAKYLGPVTWVVLGLIVGTYLVRLIRMRKRNHERRGAAGASA
ncbi:MAG TPA: DedA family protein [Polyangiaceae bacterium]|nr:DedA family protein [Polyangiaceae bacterium]